MATGHVVRQRGCGNGSFFLVLLLLYFLILRRRRQQLELVVEQAGQPSEQAAAPDAKFFAGAISIAVSSAHSTADVPVQG